MRINTITSKPNYNTISNTTNLTFKSKRQLYKIKRAEIKNLESRTVYEKASEILNKLPNGKMEKTIICNVNGKKYGIRWNTKNENNLILKIKDNIVSNDTIEWEKNKDNQTVLECFFDKNGVMQNGNITKKIKDTYSLNASYSRGNNCHKTLYMDGISYRPCLETDGYWESMPSKSCYNIKKDINLQNCLQEFELSELFCSLITKNTTIK